MLNGRYAVERALGSGAFGRVYLALDTFDRGAPPLAIKEIPLAPDASDQQRHEAISWFKREVSILLTLERPGIPAIHGYWMAHHNDGPLYLAMDYIPGPTLTELLRRAGGPLDWTQVARWGCALCQVLAYMHGCVPPFIFRDLKLDNVLVDSRTDLPVLIDFGIARQLAGATGTAIGTWGYVPMEQVLGRAEPRSDLYGLGATLFALLSGQDPGAAYTHLVHGGSDVETAMRALFRPELLAADLPADLQAILTRATAFEPDDRFPDATGMEAALRAVLDQAGQSLPLDIYANANRAPAGARDAMQQAAHAISSPDSAPPYAGTPPLASGGAAVVCTVGPGQQYLTIADALRQAPAGACIALAPGIYREKITIDRPLEIVGLGPREQIVIENVRGSCVEIHAPQAVLRGLTLRCLTGLQRQIAFGLDVTAGRVLVEDCEISAQGSSCIRIVGPHTHAWIHGCQVHHGLHHGIQLIGSARCSVLDCAIFSNGQHGILVAEDTAVLIRRCQITDNGEAAIRVERSTSGAVAVEDSDLSHNQFGPWSLALHAQAVVREARNRTD